MRSLILAIMAWSFAGVAWSAQAPAPAEKDSKPGSSQRSGKGEKPSLAETILRLQATLSKDLKDLADIQNELEKPDSAYAKAEMIFQDLEKRRSENKNLLEKLRQEGKKKEAAEAAEDAKDLETQWNLARERFNLAIQERKTLQELAGNLEAKNKRTREYLNRLQGNEPVAAKETPKKAEEPKETGAAKPAVKGNLVGLPKGKTAAEEGKNEPVAKEQKPARKEVVQAKEKAKIKEEEAARALEKVESVKERQAVLDKSIELEKNLLETLRKKADNAYAVQAALQEELNKKLAEKAPQEELQAHWQKIAAAEKEVVDIRQRIRTTTDRLADLQQEQSRVQNWQNKVLTQAEEKRKEAEAAQKELARLQNPFTPRNVLQWLIDHGPKSLAIIFGIWALHYLVRMSSRRMVAMITNQAMRGTALDRENRADTLVSVFRNAASLAVLVGGVLMLLEELGIPIIPLMGGAAVLGLAVAFGAQNLVRDYFSGFMVLLEDQYGINDVVKIGGVAGLVERITLRVTVLRDAEGTVHFIPHGTLSTVSNLTHGWSKAVFEISIAYKEDVDHVMDVLMTLARDLRRDPALGHLITGDPEMQGVDQFGDSGVLIKFNMKTLPMSQWKVKRELLRRIKKKFDELGIEIPFPHRQLIVRHENGNEQGNGHLLYEEPTAKY